MQKLSKIRLAARTTWRAFEGEPGNPNPSDPGAGSPNPVIPPNVTPPPAPVAGTGKTYTEKEFNELLNKKLSEDRRKAEEKNRPLIDELKVLRDSTNLTEQQKRQLEERVEQLQSEYQTIEERAKLEMQKLQEKYDKDTGVLKKDSESWRKRHDEQLTDVRIRDAASKFEALRPFQVAAILKPMTKVVEVMDAGRPTGKFEPSVKFPGKNAEGQPVILDVTVEEAVKIMHQMPEEYGNLFKTTAANGLGLNPTGSVNGGALPDIDKMTPQEYQANRDKIRAMARRQG